MARWALIVAAILSAFACTQTAAREEVVVFAAASLREPFTELAAAFEANEGVKVVLNFAGTQELRTQLEHGAKADVFAAADLAHFQALSEQLEDGGIFAANQLVIATAATASVATIFDLASTERIVIGAPEVPIGRYTEKLLANVEREKAGFSEAVEARIVSREANVKQVLAKVALGEANAAIVYRTDAAGVRGVKTTEIPERFNVVAEFAIAAVKGSKLGAKFVSLVRSERGRAVLSRAGFGRSN